MTLTSRLLADHKAFRKILADMGAAAAEKDTVRLLKLTALLRRMIHLHAQVEDEVYFPAAARGGAGVAPAFLHHLSQEHKTLDGYMARLQSQLEGRPPMAWPQTLALLSNGLKGHFKREEEDLFPAVDRALGASALEALTAEAETLKLGAASPAED